MTPICPKCGSIRVERKKNANNARIAMHCLESDCLHVGSRSSFMQGGPNTGQSQYTNDHWRDPIAMSMDGYDE